MYDTCSEAHKGCELRALLSSSWPPLFALTVIGMRHHQVPYSPVPFRMIIDGLFLEPNLDDFSMACNSIP